MEFIQNILIKISQKKRFFLKKLIFSQFEKIEGYEREKFELAGRATTHNDDGMSDTI